MRICLRRRWASLLLAGCALAGDLAARADHYPYPSGIIVLGDGIEFHNDPIRLVSQVESATQPPESPLQPVESPSQPIESPTYQLADASFSLPAEVRDALQLPSSPTAEAIGSGEARTNPTTDLGSLLQDSDNVQTVAAQRRSQIAFDPHVRGYHFGQIYAQSDGEYFLPVRLDLDSMLSKIDPSLIRTVTVIPGPYGLRYGPGFSFIDVVTVDTPRSCCGFEWTNRFGVNLRGNGGQISGRDTYTGAGENYGFITHFGIRSGADYTAGNGQKIPSSYHNQNALLQFGFDTSDDSRVEFRYNRLDLRDTEYALQFFDVSYMSADSFSLNYLEDDPATGDQSVAQVWYNQSRFAGDNGSFGKRELRARVAFGLNQDFGLTTPSFFGDDFSGTVEGSLFSFGARAFRTIGETTGEHVRLGADVRYLQQSTLERFNIVDVTEDPNDPNFDPGDPDGVLDPSDEAFVTNMPHSTMVDPGLFAEWTVPWGPCFKTSLGSRVSWVNTHPRGADVTQFPTLPGVSDVDLVQNDVLVAAYLTGELELTPEWTVRTGAGYAERVPDLVNRYSGGIFLGVVQNGFSKVAGIPALEKERATQVDASLVGDYGWANARTSVFYSWINDYNTYAAIGFEPPTGAQILVAQNTGLATLGGFEAYFDYELTDVTTIFTSALYVEGTDQVIDRPLPGIYPMEGRLGLRWADPEPDNIWGLEWGFRIVARQSRAGFLRDAVFDDTTSVQTESETGGFVTSYLRGYYNLTQQMHFVGGIDNLFDRNYIEHLDLRLPGRPFAPGGITAALSPGFTAYFGLEWEI